MITTKGRHHNPDNMGTNLFISITKISYGDCIEQSLAPCDRLRAYKDRGECGRAKKIPTKVNDDRANEIKIMLNNLSYLHLPRYLLILDNLLKDVTNWTFLVVHVVTFNILDAVGKISFAWKKMLVEKGLLFVSSCFFRRNGVLMAFLAYINSTVKERYSGMWVVTPIFGPDRQSIPTRTFSKTLPGYHGYMHLWNVKVTNISRQLYTSSLHKLIAEKTEAAIESLPCKYLHKGCCYPTLAGFERVISRCPLLS